MTAPATTEPAMAPALGLCAGASPPLGAAVDPGPAGVVLLAGAAVGAVVRGRGLVPHALSCGGGVGGN